MEIKTFKTFSPLTFIIGFIVLTGLVFISFYNFLLFHSLAEFFSIFIAYGLFVVAWNFRKYTDNPFLLFIGIGYFFIGSLDLIHTLSYKGMGIFQGYDSDLPTQLWIATRYMESLTLLFAAYLSKKSVNISKIVVGYLFVTIILCFSIFYLKIFPACFIEGVGLTTFKKISELIISLFLIWSVIIIVRNRNDFHENILKLIIASIILTIASELCFIFYISVYGISNIAGHYLKILSFFFIYKAVIETNLTMPRSEMFKNLKLSKESLNAKEKFLNNILESLTHPFYVIDVKSHEIILANRATYNSYGSNKQTCHALTHNRETPCNSNEHSCPLIEMKQTKKPVALEHVHYDKENNKQIIEVHGFPLLDDKGEVVQMIEYSFDITEKKQLENKLKETLEFQKKIISESPIGIMLYDDKGDCLTANRSAANMIGTTQQQVRQINYHDREVWKQSKLYNKVLTALSEKIIIKYDFIGYTSYGKKVALEHIIIPFGENRLMIMIIDILDRKKLERELNNEVEFNLALADLAQKIISAKSIEEVSMFVLEQAKRFTNSPIGYAGYIDEKTGHLVTPTLMDDAWEKCKVQDKSYEFTEFIGLWGWVLDNKKPLYLNNVENDPRSIGVPQGHVPIKSFLSVPALMDGVLLGQISLINSSGEYSDKDIEILEKIANLYSIAIHQKRMIKKLNKSKKEADAANLAKSNFLSNMSHEIRTPMNSILGFSELLGTMVSDPKQKSYIDSIYTSGELLLSIINDILDLSKIEAGKLQLNTDSMNPCLFFESIRKLFSMQTSQKKIDLIFEIDPDISTNLFLDEVRLTQVLTNLISNALKFTDTGYIKVLAKQFENKNATIDFLIVVEDTGIGIGPEFQEKLFEPFSQKDGQDSRKYGGTGLGLSITRNLIEMMGGEISVKSEIGKGSTFTILIKQVKTGSKISMGSKSNLIAHDNEPGSMKNSEIAIPEDMFSKIPKILDSLEKPLMKEWESITRNHHLPDIENFANLVKKLGEKYKIIYIIEYGENLLLHVNNFDIEQIQVSLNDYQDIIKQVKTLSIGGNS